MLMLTREELVALDKELRAAQNMDSKEGAQRVVDLMKPLTGRDLRKLIEIQKDMISEQR